jgi:hypothetical protein
MRNIAQTKTEMKKLASICFLVLFASCAAKIIPLKGNYPQTPIIFKSENSFEKTWDKLIDVFAQKGLAIKIIDRSSGLIISTNSEMAATPEDSKGNPKNPNAFIAVPSIKSNNQIKPLSGSNQGAYTAKSKIVYYPVYGEWNVRVKPDGAGSLINVNITNVTYVIYGGTKGTDHFLPLKGYKSTGVFEKDLADLIK